MASRPFRAPYKGNKYNVMQNPLLKERIKTEGLRLKDLLEMKVTERKTDFYDKSLGFRRSYSSFST